MAAPFPEPKEAAIEPRELADALMELLAEKKTTRIVLLDLQGISLIAEFFLIGTAESTRQLQAILREIDETMGGHGVSPLRVEGTAESGWIVVDFGSVILHLFDSGQRDYYQLERLWHRARTVAVMP